MWLGSHHSQICHRSQRVPLKTSLNPLFFFQVETHQARRKYRARWSKKHWWNGPCSIFTPRGLVPATGRSLFFHHFLTDKTTCRCTQYVADRKLAGGGVRVTPFPKMSPFPKSASKNQLKLPFPRLETHQARREYRARQAAV